MARQRGWKLAVFVGSLLLSLVGTAGAAGHLRALDVDLGAETGWFAMTTWQGRPAVSAFTGYQPPQGAPVVHVQVVVLADGALRVAGRWRLPPATHYVEPLRLPGHGAGWLMLVGAQWRVAVPEGAALRWIPLCGCDTIYSQGGIPEPVHHHFAFDLDGDGVDEVLLPYPDRLEAVRLAPGTLAPQTLWRIAWHPDGTPLARRKKTEQGYRLLHFTLVDLDPQHRRQVVIQERERLLIAAQPAPVAGQVPSVRPYAVPLTGLGSFGADDRHLMLGLTDMDGDGVLDVLHAKLLNYGSVLSQHNELRWYRGRIEGGRLALAPPTDALRSDSGSFAELERPRTSNAPPLALLMASTEVSLSSVMKALASQQVTLQARVLPFHAGALGTQAVAGNQFTYSELRAAGRRAMFLFADLNGDGWRDYLLNLLPDQLSVYLSAGGPPGLRQPSFVQGSTSLPSRPERVLIADLDGDGHEELVLRFREKYHAGLGNKLRVLRYEP